ncbi:ribosome biogenesis protein Nop16 [Coniochaeta sp. 2T2.1]|nr:ribosome biogenesis protein Nop16 [Coniochaeta sp. 2T2.1]
MGRELQKRKNRSSRATVRQPVRRKKALNPSGNQLIAQNWNKKETLSQNYRRLGLVAKLGHSAGGVEPRDSPLASSTQTGPVEKRTKSKIHSQSLLKQVYSEARVERDPETGKIIRIVRAGGKEARKNPLNDPLARFDEDSDDDMEDGEGEGEWEGIDEEQEEEEENKRPMVIRQLEKEANAPREKVVRHQSEREREWLESLVKRHGDDIQAMARDGRLNPMQQTASDIRRRLKKAGLLE